MDLAALVVGYAMAALLVSAFWPRSETPTAGVAVVLGLAYVWLGLAMGGPLVLWIDRRAEPGPARYTWAELSWLLIGGYWLALTLLVVPVRMRVTPLFGVFPIVAALALRVFVRPRPAPATDAAAWTHRVGVGLVLTWPVAWAALILLSQG